MTDDEIDAAIKDVAVGEVTYRDREIFLAGRKSVLAERVHGDGGGGGVVKGED